MNNFSDGPLKGLKVLDLTRMLPGPFCTLFLADLGAEVIMVEQPFGAAMGPRKKHRYLDRNKKSIALNLKDPKAKEILYQLVSEIDVVVEGFRPGVTTRLEIDYQKLKEINNGLIYCSISGYGQDGPYRDRVGHDINYIAIAGTLSLTGAKDQDPVIPGTQVADISGGGLTAAASILAAVFFKEKTGQGQYIDISMTDGALSLNPVTIAEYIGSGRLPLRQEHRLLGSLPCYSVYKTKDNKHIVIGALEPKFWMNFCTIINREDLIEKQYDEGPETFGVLRDVFSSKNRTEWDEILESEEVCYSPVFNLDETIQNEHFLHRQMIVEVEGPDGTKSKQVGIVPKFSLTPARIRRPTPNPGQHTYEVLHSLGKSQDEIFKLEKEKAIKGYGHV